ncbi:hypothetical protein QTG56_26045 (plasmid) [Rossellomorea sp. AcN35-11]|nr:hypothetical protein [Rossellomorea aquimaris]WJV32079.1 hypothetical protein QTG56_26045 [Rossellomorea sp. AcN35-11]
MRYIENVNELESGFCGVSLRAGSKEPISNDITAQGGNNEIDIELIIVDCVQEYRQLAVELGFTCVELIENVDLAIDGVE